MRYAVIFRSPNLGSCDARFDQDGRRQFVRSCEDHDGTQIYGEEKGYPFWIARLIQRVLCFFDERGYSHLRKIENGN